MNDEKWIVSDRNHLRGKPGVQGTRISVAFLLECLASGMSLAEIVDAYSTLSENAVQGALRDLAHEKEVSSMRILTPPHGGRILSIAYGGGDQVISSSVHDTGHKSDDDLSSTIRSKIRENRIAASARTPPTPHC
jgi:uncharacterized protein (DUF433 family)